MHARHRARCGAQPKSLVCDKAHACVNERSLHVPTFSAISARSSTLTLPGLCVSTLALFGVTPPIPRRNPSTRESRASSARARFHVRPTPSAGLVEAGAPSVERAPEMWRTPIRTRDLVEHRLRSNPPQALCCSLSVVLLTSRSATRAAHLLWSAGRILCRTQATSG